ncbi:MAG: hypothetical protein IH820_09045 [Bacteroidetes bacterium]|nr:hypothetical protein [Bacteroidota bacterium]
MPQTMLAILAMMMFSLFAVQQQKKVYVAQHTMIRQAVTTMLNGASVERLEEIGSNGYDQAVVDNEILSSSAELSSPDPDFGPGNDHTAEDDLDDFHMAVDTLYRAVGADSLGFVVESEVEYASELDPELPAAPGTKTKYKLVTVTARCLTLPDLEIHISRSFSCGSACQW